MSDQHLANEEQVKDLESTEAVAARIARDLRGHPEWWMKGKLVRFEDGSVSDYTTDVRRHPGVCWCLYGHIIRVAKRPYSTLQDFEEALGIGDVPKWNDADDRTVTDVIAACDRVAGIGAGFAYFRARTLSALEVSK